MTDDAAPRLDARQRRWVESAAARVPRLARALVRSLPGVDADDLESAGNEALVRAAFRYDPASGVTFERFAHYRVRGAMIDFARSRNRAGRQARRAEKALEASQALLEAASRSAPDARASLAERVAAAKALVEKTAAAAIMSRACDADVEGVSSAEGDAEHLLLSRERREAVRACMETLDDEQRALIEAVYIEGVPMQAHADRIGKSLSTVSRRHAKILGILAARLRQRGHVPSESTEASDGDSDGDST